MSPSVDGTFNMLMERLSHSMQKLQMAHLVAAKNVLRYLKGTLDFGTFCPAKDRGDLLTYADADWAGHADSLKSSSRILYKLGSTPIA